MENSAPTLRTVAGNDSLAKTSSELDSIAQALLSAVPQSKPWQRQLRAHLTQLAGEVQILRMTVSMERDEVEIRQAAYACNLTLRAANTFVAGGRADMGTKAAVRFAFELGQRIQRCLDA